MFKFGENVGGSLNFRMVTFVGVAALVDLLTPSYRDVELVKMWMSGKLACLVSLVSSTQFRSHCGAVVELGGSALLSSRSGRGGVLRFIGSDR